LGAAIDAEDRSATDCCGAETRAASWGSTTRAGGGTCGISVRGGAGGGADLAGDAGFAGPAGDGGGITGVAEAATWGKLAA
jgi:hypothetical protein